MKQHHLNYSCSVLRSGGPVRPPITNQHPFPPPALPTPAAYSTRLLRLRSDTLTASPEEPNETGARAERDPHAYSHLHIAAETTAATLPPQSDDTPREPKLQWRKKKKKERKTQRMKIKDQKRRL